jgi:hypothetical protein
VAEAGAAAEQGGSKAAAGQAKPSIRAGAGLAARQAATADGQEAAVKDMAAIDDAATPPAAEAAASAPADAARAPVPGGIQALANALKSQEKAADGKDQKTDGLAAPALDPLAGVRTDATGAPGAAGGTVAGSSAAAPTDAARGAQAASAPVPVSALPIEIGMRALEGSQSFSIRLHPEELGRVDVKLHISDDGSVKAQIVVDRVDTLAMLQRDAKTLERSFEQAGLRTSDTGLQFSLSSDTGQQQRPGPQQDATLPRTTPLAQGFDALTGQDLASALAAIRNAAGGLDIRI